MSSPNPLDGETSIARLEAEQPRAEDDATARDLAEPEPVDAGADDDDGDGPSRPPRKDREQEEEDDDDDDDEDDDDDDEDEEDDEEDDDDDDEEEDAGRDARGKKRRHKRPRMSRYLDVEAEVDDEEEDEDEEADFEAIESGFIENDRLSPDEAADHRAHRRLDRLQADENERSAQEIARELKERYRRNRTAYDGSANFTDRKANMPGPADPKLWQVRCKSGSEKNIVNAIFLKLMMAIEKDEAPVEIYSAFQRDSLPGMIFVEAFRAQHVQQALVGIANVYLYQSAQGRQGQGPNPIQLVENRDMVALLTMKKKVQNVKKGMWVRVKRGKYAGDLAKVTEILGDGLSVAVDLVPRIDYNPERNIDRKRKKGTAALLNRPPQRLFNPDDVVDAYGRGAFIKRQGRYIFGGDEYFNGLLDKEFPITSLQVDSVNPKLEEIQRFSAEADVDDILNKAAIDIAKQRAEQYAELLPGDAVEATDGAERGLRGTVDSVSKDIVVVKYINLDRRGEEDTIELPIKNLRKVFKPGDHVKVISGQEKDESGMVLDVTGNRVTFLSDKQERGRVEVFDRDLRVSAEVGASNNRVGQFELHDLVMVDLQTAGVIVDIQRNSASVLDQNGRVRSLLAHQMTRPTADVKRAVGLDRDNKEFRLGDQLKEADGEMRRGVVLHIHRGLFAFLRSHDITENGGIFVVRSRNLIPLDARASARTSGPDLTKQDPTLSRSMPTNLGSAAPNLRHLINTPVVVVKGTHKGLRGVIKDTTGDKARVELATNNRVITLGFESLKKKDPVTGVVSPLEMRNQKGQYQLPSQESATTNPYTQTTPGMPTTNPYAMGGRTPYGGATVNPYAQGGRTPAIASYASVATPNPYAMSGGKTPGAGYAQTPNPYATGKTPNPYAMGGQTPFLGGQTPFGAGGRTPFMGAR